MSKIFYYNLKSKLPEDQTKGNLTKDDLDNNFYNLKRDDIESVEFIEEGSKLIIKLKGNEKIEVLLNLEEKYLIKTQTDIPVKNVTIGQLTDGDKIPAGASFEDILKLIVQAENTSEGLIPTMTFKHNLKEYYYYGEIIEYLTLSNIDYKPNDAVSFEHFDIVVNEDYDNPVHRVYPTTEQPDPYPGVDTITVPNPIAVGKPFKLEFLAYYRMKGIDFDGEEIIREVEYIKEEIKINTHYASFYNYTETPVVYENPIRINNWGVFKIEGDVAKSHLIDNKDRVFYILSNFNQPITNIFLNTNNINVIHAFNRVTRDVLLPDGTTHSFYLYTLETKESICIEGIDNNYLNIKHTNG